ETAARSERPSAVLVLTQGSCAFHTFDRTPGRLCSLKQMTAQQQHAAARRHAQQQPHTAVRLMMTLHIVLPRFPVIHVERWKNTEVRFEVYERAEDRSMRLLSHHCFTNATKCGSHGAARGNDGFGAHLRARHGRLQTMLEAFSQRVAALQHTARQRDADG